MKQLFVYIIINTLTGAPLDSSGQQILYHSLGTCNVAASNLTWALQNHTAGAFKCVQIPDPQGELYTHKRHFHTEDDEIEVNSSSHRNGAKRGYY